MIVGDCMNTDDGELHSVPKRVKPRAETLWYLKLNGNWGSVNHYLNNRERAGDSSIKYHRRREDGYAEIVSDGYKIELLDDLKMFGILSDDLSTTTPMKTYNLPSSSIPNYHKVLDLVGNGTSCADLGGGVVEIKTDLMPSRIAKTLGCKENEITVIKNKGGEKYGRIL